MKNQTSWIQLAACAAVIVIGFGCAKENGGSAPAGSVDTTVTPTTVTPTPTPTPTPVPDIGNPFANETGGQADFTPTSLTVFNSYVNLHPVNAPKGYRINVNLQDIGGDSASPIYPNEPRFAGSVKIAYYDNGNWYVATFDSGRGTNQVSYQDRTTGRSEATFNHWYTLGSTKVFHGFFQDQYGAIVLVIDGFGGTTDGDGQTSTLVKGSIWFKNFTTSYASQSPEKCWFIRVGPYDCRTFLINNNPDKSEREIYSFSNPVEPSTADGYTKLGTFTGLNKASAFGN